MGLNAGVLLRGLPAAARLNLPPSPVLHREAMNRILALAFGLLSYRALRKELKFSASSPAPTKNDRITRGFCLKRPTAR